MIQGYFPGRDLREVARSFYKDSSFTQEQLAKELGVSQPTLSEALSERSRRPFTEILIGVIEACSDYTVEGPSYRLIKKK